VQISGASTALQISQADIDKASKALADAGIAVKAGSLGKNSGLIRLAKTGRPAAGQGHRPPRAGR
jgi:hypothetical protein